MKEKMKSKTQIVTESENTQVFVRTGGTGKEYRKPSKKKLIIIPAVIVLVVIAAAILLPNYMPQLGSGVMVSVAPAERMDLEQTVSIRGTIEGSESADVASALNYRITAIYVQEGDKVTKDQILATLDTSDLLDSYNKAVLARNEARRALETAETLYAEGAIARDEYLRARATLQDSNLTVASFDIAEKKNIRSPIDGTVTRVNVSIGRYASDTENRQPMFVVENLEDLQMKVRISEYDISKIRVGQDVTVTAEVLGSASVSGTVSKISPTGEAKDMASNEMVIPVVIDIDKGDLNLIAGVTARATISIEKRSMVLTVSIDAIMEDPETGETSVFIVEEGLLKRVPVELGLEGQLYVEIVGGGLSEGDSVVLVPSYEMVDGQAVEVYSAELL